MQKSFSLAYLFISLAVFLASPGAIAGECDNWLENHPEWIWCDDFESSQALSSRYEDVSTDGMSRSTSQAFDGNASLRQVYRPGQVDAGWVTKVDNAGFPDHIFYRWYHRFGPGYQGNYPPKMARIGYRNRSNWQTVFMVHSWIDRGEPVLDVVANNSTDGPWLPIAFSGFDLQNVDEQWVSYEVEVKLNTPGAKDGLYRLWVDDELKIERTNVDLRGSTSDKINEIMLDAYWNSGAPRSVERFYDNFVISTQRIGGSQQTVSPPAPPSSIRANTIGHE